VVGIPLKDAPIALPSNMPAAIEHQVIPQADTGFVPITSICAVEQNTRPLGHLDIGCRRTNQVAASKFVADNHASFSIGHGEAGSPVKWLFVGHDRATRKVTYNMLIDPEVKGET
jgi:hypothetical protein